MGRGLLASCAQRPPLLSDVATEALTPRLVDAPYFQSRNASSTFRLMHSSLLELLFHGVAFVMAILEFLLRCFRRRAPTSEQKRPLCTEEDSAQDDSTDSPQLITPGHKEAGQQSVPHDEDAVQAFPRLSAQRGSSREDLGVEADSSFGFTEGPGATVAQVCCVL